MYFRILISCFLLFLAVIPAKSQSMGCTDIAAINYNSLATINDGSCIYADTSILPDNSFELNSILRETSGLILWNNRLWTFNDNDDVTLYSLDTINGEILDSLELTGTENRDWEAISQDDAFIYLGDFGNNEHGNRSDLKIYKISKSSLLIGSPEIEIISFNYPEQTSLEPTSNNQTDYDCEAMIVKDEAIYLFTKQWISSGTSIYSIPIIAGNYAAELIGEYPIAGLVTDATFIPEKSIVMLCGYNTVLQPFIYLLYDINSDDFFGANKRRIQLSLPFHQIEGIASLEGNKIYLSNERFAPNPLIDVDAKLHAINLNSILGNYLLNNTSSPDLLEFSIHPNPFTNHITIELNQSLAQTILQIQIRNITGDILETIFTDKALKIKVDLSKLNHGEYIVELIGLNYRKSAKVIK